MKKIALIAAAAILSLGTITLSAQDKKEGNYGWKEKMMSEKIGFITARLQLTPEEAQAFWPVYNKISAQKDEALKASRQCYKDLRTAIKEEKGEKEVSNLLNKYMDAVENAQKIEKESIPQLNKVLDGVKVAKLFIAEEAFRKQQINKLQHGGQQHQPQGKPAGYQGGKPAGFHGGCQGGKPEGKAPQQK